MATGAVILNQTISTLPVNGTNAVQTLAIGGTPTAGTFLLTWNGLSSPSITWSATNATLLANIQTALDWLFNSGGTSAANCIVSDSTLSSGIGNALITFRGSYGAAPQPLLVAVSSLTGTSPTAAVTTTTVGITASDRQAALGETLIFTGMNASNEVQTLTIGGTPTGTFTVTGATAANPGVSLTTAAITWSATNATLLSNLQSALDTKFGTNNVIAALGTITSGVGTITLTFSNAFAFTAMSANGALFTATGLTTGTTTIALTTTGGVASSRTGYPLVYENVSPTAFSPTWVPNGNAVYINLGNPAVASDTAIHAAVTATGSTITITTAITNPDFPRQIQIKTGGTAGNVLAVQCTVVGTDCNGNALTELAPVFTAGNQSTVVTVNAFKTVTSITQPEAGTSVTVSYGTTAKVGLGIIMSASGAYDTVDRGYVTVISSGVATIEATRPVGVPSTTLPKNLVSFTSALSTLNNMIVKVSPGI